MHDAAPGRHDAMKQLLEEDAKETLAAAEAEVETTVADEMEEAARAERAAAEETRK